MSTIVNPQKVNEVLSSIDKAKQKNADIFNALDDLMYKQLPEVWNDSKAAAAYQSQYNAYKKGIMTSFANLMNIYSESLGTGASDLMIDDTKLAEKMNDQLGV